MVEPEKILIIDNGSDMIKAGFGGHQGPHCVFPTIVGRTRGDSVMGGVLQKEKYIGDEAMAKKGILNLSYPMSAGIVQSWEDMEKVWHHTFHDELSYDPAQSFGVFLTDDPLNSKRNREKMTSIMFETFGVKKFHIANKSLMALFGAGKITGIVCDAGESIFTVPVFEGVCKRNAVVKMEITGRVLTQWMAKLLECENGIEKLCLNPNSFNDMTIARDIKEKVCFAQQDEFDETFQLYNDDRPFTLPDKSIVKVTKTIRSRCPELLFDPTLN